jgi:Zn-dependent metalloprotease
MAKKAKKAKARKRPPHPPGPFRIMAMHVTEKHGRRIFQALKADRPAVSTFAMTESQPKNLDSESAAKRILHHALASKAMPSLTAPKVDGEESDFRSLGVETVPLTGTIVVKFRQQVKGISVFASLVSVELNDDHDMVSINSSLATPELPSYVARISPHDALKKIAGLAGYGRELPPGIPKLHLFLDHKSKWHLAYIAEDIRIREKAASPAKRHRPLVHDYVIDALTGALVAELPRTPTARAVASGIDELDRRRTFAIETGGGMKAMRDTKLNIETYDLRYGDPADGKLPGRLVSDPWSSAAVSAHANTAIVVTFLRKVLKRNNIDNKGGRVVSTVNCLPRQPPPPGRRIWANAMWDGTQMLYGQLPIKDADGKSGLRSLAASLAASAHELFHGVSGHTARLIYQGESGALNESYSDIFGTLIANSGRQDIGKWDWRIGDGISPSIEAFRSMRDPTLYDQPKHMRNYCHSPLTPGGDQGGVHKNSGIHNYAAYRVMSATNRNGFIFKPRELAAIFYVALTQQLSRQSTFSDSRRGVVLATRSLFRALPRRQLEERVQAVKDGFKAAGITR